MRWLLLIVLLVGCKEERMITPVAQAAPVPVDELADYKQATELVLEDIVTAAPPDAFEVDWELFESEHQKTRLKGYDVKDIRTDMMLARQLFYLQWQLAIATKKPFDVERLTPTVERIRTELAKL